MNIEVLDDIFSGIGYDVASLDITDIVNGSETRINAIGRPNAVCDKTQILQHLGGYGIQIIKFDLNIDRNFSPVVTIGSRAMTHVMGVEEINISVSCYTDSIPSHVAKPKPLPVPDNDPNFNLRGSL